MSARSLVFGVILPALLGLYLLLDGLNRIGAIAVNIHLIGWIAIIAGVLYLISAVLALARK